MEEIEPGEQGLRLYQQSVLRLDPCNLHPMRPLDLACMDSTRAGMFWPRMPRTCCEALDAERSSTLAQPLAGSNFRQETVPRKAQSSSGLALGD